MKRIKSYVKGLDNEMQGGIPDGSVILVAGKPGTMKSSFAFNILYHNANKDDKSGVYVTLEQGRDSLLANMEGLGMKLSGLEKEISVLDLGMIRKKLIQLTNQTWMEVFKMYLKNLKKNMDIKLVVIDSREVELTRYAHVWLRPAPGTEQLLLGGLLKSVIDQGFQKDD